MAPTYIGLGQATYLGGWSMYSRQESGSLWVTDTAIGIGQSGPQAPAIGLDLIDGIDVESSQVAKSRVGPVLAFGVLGLAAKGSQSRSVVTVHLKSDERAYFEVLGMDDSTVKAKLGPWISKHDLGQQRRMPGTATTAGLVAEIERLGELHAAGTLTDVEFSAAKAQLLGL